MKKAIFSLLLGLFTIGFGLLVNTNQVHAGYVNGYYRSNGTYVNGYYRNTPSYNTYTPSYNSYTPSYNTRNYPSYSGGLKYQDGYYKPSTGSYVQGYYKTYSDGNTWNNRKNLYGW